MFYNIFHKNMKFISVSQYYYKLNCIKSSKSVKNEILQYYPLVVLNSKISKKNNFIDLLFFSEKSDIVILIFKLSTRWVSVYN